MKLHLPKLKKLNTLGVTHLLIPVLAIVVIGGIGTYLLGVDHADPINATAIVAYSGNNDGCGSNATHYVYNTATKKTVHVGQSSYGENSYCKCSNGHANVIYGPAYQGSAINPKCNATTALPAGYILAYSGNNDGCGSNATHYVYDASPNVKKTIHVGQTYYGTGSYCKCSNGHANVAYGPAYQGSATNPKCNAAAPVSTKSCIPVNSAGYATPPTDNEYYVDWIKGDGSTYGICYSEVPPHDGEGSPIAKCLAEEYWQYAYQDDGTGQYVSDCIIPATAH